MQPDPPLLPGRRGGHSREDTCPDRDAGHIAVTRINRT
jgi:hypothetical protein